jgi:hypothetical protein
MKFFCYKLSSSYGYDFIMHVILSYNEIKVPVTSAESFRLMIAKMEVENEDTDPRDNLGWVEQVILNNLSMSHIQQEDDNNELENPPTDPTSKTLITSQNTTPGELRVDDSIKLFIIEIEMRDESFYADSEMEVPTMSRLITARIKYFVCT